MNSEQWVHVTRQKRSFKEMIICCFVSLLLFCLLKWVPLPWVFQFCKLLSVSIVNSKKTFTILIVILRSLPEEFVFWIKVSPELMTPSQEVLIELFGSFNLINCRFCWMTQKVCTGISLKPTEKPRRKQFLSPIKERTESGGYNPLAATFYSFLDFESDFHVKFSLTLKQWNPWERRVAGTGSLDRISGIFIIFHKHFPRTILIGD